MDRWNELEEQFKHVTDALGKPIDAGIFQTVVAFNALGVSTIMSCEGHVDHGLPYPWIDVRGNTARLDIPQEVRELQIKLRELLREWEKQPERQQAKVREEKRDAQVRYRLFCYLSEFYENRIVPFDRVITFIHPHRIRSQGGDYLELLSPDERLQKLHEYQEEMQAFTAFLKSTYFFQSDKR